MKNIYKLKSALTDLRRKNSKRLFNYSRNILLLAIMFLVSLALNGQTIIYVNSSTGDDATGDGGSGSPYKTFYKGYTEAVDNDTIDLTGTFTWTDADETGDVATNGYVLGKNLTIRGQGAGTTIIQADATANTADRRIFTISSSYTITIEDLTLRHGNLTSNGNGGAIYIGSITTDVTIDGCILESNVASTASYTYSYGGGAIYCYNSNASGGQLIVSNSVIRNNTSTNCWGGGIYHYRGTTGTGCVVIENTTITENTAANGTALSGYYGAYIATNSTITGNYSSNCVIMSNHSYGMFYMTNVTFAYNDLGSSSRGIYFENVADIRIKNSILAQNKRTDNSLYDYYRTGGTLNESTNNIIEMQGISDFTDGVDGNIIGEQECLGLTSTLDLNGSSGVSQTLALTSNSVAINGGTTTANGSVSIPTADQRGTARVGLPDIGAYEFTGTPVTPSISIDTLQITGLDYGYTKGPSEAQDFVISAEDIIDSIIIAAPANYEISASDVYSDTVILHPIAGTIDETTIHVRLKAGLSIGEYNNEIINVTAMCIAETVSCSGKVSDLLTISGYFTVLDKTYDGEVTATIDENNLAIEGIDPGHDDVDFDTIIVAFEDKNAAEDKVVYIVSVLLSGSDADYYFLSLDDAPDTIATIEKIELTVINAAAQNKMYDGTTDAEVTSDGLSGVLGSEDVSIDDVTGEFASADIGADISVTVVFTLTGVDAANYEVTQPTGLTANIFASGDADESGTIDEGEICGDTDANGSIDGGEVCGDINGNGVIDGDEIEGDANGNGVIDGDEGVDINAISLVNAGISVYPNPAGASLFIDTRDASGPYMYELLNTLGTSVVTDKLDESNNNLIDLSAVPNGTYILMISNGDMKYFERVVIRK
jgi:hypothetical protein